MLAMVIILAFTLTGCNNLNNNISDQDYNAIADYMASMILKYDRSYDEKLIAPAIIAEAASKAEKTSDLNEGDTKKDSSTGISENEGNSSGNAKDSKEAEDYKELVEVIGYKNLDIQYANYKLYDSFPDKKDEEYFTLEAGNNKKLCVVQFNIKNKTSKGTKFNLLNKEIKYQLVADSNTYTPLLTLLVNDMQFIDISIQGEKSEKGYLVFEVPKDIQLDKVNLLVSRDSLKSSIELK